MGATVDQYEVINLLGPLAFGALGQWQKCCGAIVDLLAAGPTSWLTPGLSICQASSSLHAALPYGGVVGGFDATG